MCRGCVTLRHSSRANTHFCSHLFKRLNTIIRVRMRRKQVVCTTSAQGVDDKHVCGCRVVLCFLIDNRFGTAGDFAKG
ncbi:hypothetical protein D9M69_608730 [compost metagenome]